MAKPRALISPRTRDLFREACSDWSDIRLIARAFINEGIQPSSDTARNWDENGQRRGVFDRYTAGVDWMSQQHIREVLPVFDEILSWVAEGADRDKIIQMLGRDGYTVDDLGRISGGPGAFEIDIPLEGLTGPTSILEHLDRIASTTDTDPGVAISGAKALYRKPPPSWSWPNWPSSTTNAPTCQLS